MARSVSFIAASVRFHELWPDGRARVQDGGQPSLLVFSFAVHYE